MKEEVKKYYINQEEELLVFEPSIYWRIYKSSNGKALIKLKLYINDMKLSLPEPEYYFRDKEAGVYGIYYKDKLLYIGSASSYIDRYYNAFKNKDGKYNIMYANQGINADEIEFRLLYGKEDFVELQSGAKIPEKNRKYLDAVTYEMIEREMIELFKPLYNLEGKIMPYNFKSSSYNGYNMDSIKRLEPVIKERIEKDWKEIRKKELEEVQKK